MTSVAMREKVKKYIDKADDKTLYLIYAMLEAEKQYDFWDDLPDSVRKDIDAAIKQSEKGMGKPHKEVMEKYSKWLTK